MPSTYVPRPDNGVRDWALNFAALVCADPFAHGLTRAEADEARALVDDFVTKLTVALEPVTRTTVAVAAKNAARKAMLWCLRGLAQAIRARRGVPEERKVALGLAPLRRARTRIPAPSTAPQLQVEVAGSMVHSVQFADEATPTRRAKPRGVIAMQLFVSVSSEPPAGPGVERFAAILSRQGRLVPFEFADAGRTAYYWARWQNAKGEVGPWSRVTARTVAA